MRKTLRTNVKLQLSRKERAILWAVMAWFSDDLGAKGLTARLYPGELVAKLSREYDTAIEDRIIELGKWLEERRAKNQ